jgi:beta-galactosidase
MREKLLLDQNWLFYDGEIEVRPPQAKTPIYLQAKTERALYGPAAVTYPDQGAACDRLWEAVDLPHDYIIRQTPSPAYSQTLGCFDYHNAWYRRHLRLSDADRSRRLWLYFEGIATQAVVYVNGCLMQRNFCGYTSFYIDISDVARFEADNVIAVHVIATEHEGWWYEGAGIYRHVWLIKTDPTAVDWWGVWVNPQRIDPDTWSVPVELTLRHDAESATVEIESTLIDPVGQPVMQTAGQLALTSRGKAVLCRQLTVTGPCLWDIESPQLYTLRTVVSRAGQVVDAVDTSFGFRTIRFTADHGFFLNDRPVKIKGVCCHQDYGLTGKAMPDRVHHYRLRRLKEMGANGYRTAHYPPAEATMDALDQLGFLVMAETRWFESTPEGLAQLEMMLRRDRNRPSVILWSVGNEEPLHLHESGRRILETMTAHVKRLDPARPVTTAISHDPLHSTAAAASEVIGVNYNLQQYDALHQMYPDKPILAAECCAVGTTRGWYWPDDEQHGYFWAHDHAVGQFVNNRAVTWRHIMDRTWVAGGFQWAGIEHRGETVWPRLCSQSGALDLFLQPKDAWYQNQSHWLDEPMIHILPHWNHPGRTGEILPVWVYSNCTELELYQDGVSLGTQQPEPYAPGIWSVVYTPGELAAVGRCNGRTAARTTIRTSGPAVKLVLKLEDEGVRADGEDVAIITCFCIDAEGLPVPDAAPLVHVNTNGLGRILGTGSDVCDHRPVTEPDRQMRAGLCSIIVQAGSKAGTLRIYAAAAGLEPASLAIELTQAPRRPWVR